MHGIPILLQTSFSTTKDAVVDLAGFLGFRVTPLFVVLHACVAGLVHVHEAGENVLDSGTPLFKILDPPLKCDNRMKILSFYNW